MGLSYGEIMEQAAALPEPISLRGSRLVLHIQTSEKAVDDLLNLVREMASEKKAAGFVGRSKPVNGVIYGDVYVRH